MTKSEEIEQYLKELAFKGVDIRVLPTEKAQEIANKFGVSKSLVYSVKKKVLKDLESQKGEIEIVKKPKPLEAIKQIFQPTEEEKPIDEEYVRSTLEDTFKVLDSILKSMDIEIKEELRPELASRWAKVLVEYGIELPKEMALISAIGLTAYVYGLPLAQKFLFKPKEEEEAKQEEAKEKKGVYKE